jgi:hypothetical protein
MIDNFNNKAIYCQNEDILLRAVLGLDSVQDRLNESEIQNLHNKIHYMIECAQKKTEGQSLYEQYFRSGQCSRDIKKIDKNLFKWDSLNEKYALPDVSGDKKMKIEYYDSVTNTYKGKPITPELIMSLLTKGIILKSSHNKASDMHLNR